MEKTAHIETGDLIETYIYSSHSSYGRALARVGAIDSDPDDPNIDSLSLDFGTHKDTYFRHECEKIGGPTTELPFEKARRIALLEKSLVEKALAYAKAHGTEGEVVTHEKVLTAAFELIQARKG